MITKLKVLVVDDEVAISEALESVIARYHEVKFLADSGEAFALLMSGEFYYVVFCDLTMPGLSRMDIDEKLRDAGVAVFEKIAFMTGGAFTPRAIEFMNTVPNPKLEKRFSKAVILSMLEGVAREKACAKGFIGA